MQKTCFNYYVVTPDTVSISSYIKDNYYLKVFSGHNNKDKNPSYLACMVSQLIRGIVQRKLLPKAIIVVIEDGLIYDAEYDNYSAVVFTEELNHIAKTYAKIVKNYKEMVPVKSKKDDYPKFMWVMAPHHDSF